MNTKLLTICLLLSTLLSGCATLFGEKFIYIQEQSEFDIWYHAYPDYYYGDSAGSHFWVRYQIRGHQKCIGKIQLHFFLIYDEKTYPISFAETCPSIAVTGDRGFPIPAHIQEIIKDNSRLNTRFRHFDYLN